MQKKKIQRNEKKKFRVLALTEAASLLSQGKISKKTYNGLLKLKSLDEYEEFYKNVTNVMFKEDYLDLLRMKENIRK